MTRKQTCKYLINRCFKNTGIVASLIAAQFLVLIMSIVTPQTVINARASDGEILQIWEELKNDSRYTLYMVEHLGYTPPRENQGNEELTVIRQPFAYEDEETGELTDEFEIGYRNHGVAVSQPDHLYITIYDNEKKSVLVSQELQFYLTKSMSLCEIDMVTHNENGCYWRIDAIQNHIGFCDFRPNSSRYSDGGEWKTYTDDEIDQILTEQYAKEGLQPTGNGCVKETTEQTQGGGRRYKYKGWHWVIREFDEIPYVKFALVVHVSGNCQCSKDASADEYENALNRALGSYSDDYFNNAKVEYRWMDIKWNDDKPSDIVTTPPEKQEDKTKAEKEKDDPSKTEPDKEFKEKDPGTTISNTIVQGKKEDKEDENDPTLPGIVGGLVVGGIIAGKKKKDKDSKKDKDNKKKEKEKEEEEEEDPVEFKMILYKEFGDTLRIGETQYVFARIEEHKIISGGKYPRDDLTAQIGCYSASGDLIVEDAGLSVNGCSWRAAKVTVPESCVFNEADVTFTFTGVGGVYTRHVMFNIEKPLIIFAQENLGLPANKLKNAMPDPDNKESRLGEQEIYLPFEVMGLPYEGTKVSLAPLKFDYSTDVNGNCVEGPLDKKTPVPYELEIKKDEEKNKKGVYEIHIKEVADYEMPAGTTEGFIMTVIAEHGDEGKDGYIKIEQQFPIFRIHLGIVFTVEGDSIPCYAQVKPEKVKSYLKQVTSTPKPSMLAGKDDADGMVAKPKDVFETGGAATLGTLQAAEEAEQNLIEEVVGPKDTEPVYGEGSIIIFMYRKKDFSIVRAPAEPVSPDCLKFTVKKLENDRWCRTGDITENHQKTIDALKIKVFSTGRLNTSGAHILKFSPTENGLDAPQRFICEMEMQVKYMDKVYTVKKDVLLRSQPFRTPKDTSESLAFVETDRHIGERLIYIQSQIRDYGISSLGSVYNLIDRMLEGYDERFGYDVTQVANVMRMWTGYLNGTYCGANGTPKGVTIADDIEALYAFAQGLRDNTGILGRVAMGIMSCGYSEYVFSTMTLGEEMKKKVFECHGDKDFGFWDGVQMGVKEFSTQILLELAMGGINIKTKVKPGTGMKGVSKELQAVTKEIHIPGLAEIGNEFVLKYTNVDVGGTMKMWATRYRNVMDKSDAWIKGKFTGKNYTNSSAKQLKAGIEEMAEQVEKSSTKAKELVAKARKNLTPEELAELTIDSKAAEHGMEEVVKLKKLQMQMEKVSGDAKLLKEAKAAYRMQADVVMTNKNALKQLQRAKGDYAQRMRAQFNEYRENLFDDVQRGALKDIAEELGCSADDLYVMNVSNGSNKAYKQGLKVPGDRDISFKRKVYSDKTGYTDLTIDQELGQRAVAKRLYRKMNGRDADTIEEALRFMKEKDVTYVNPESFAKNADGTYNHYVFEHNLDGYEDLKGMVGMVPDPDNPTKMIMKKDLLANDLHNKVINQKSVWHKGVEWFETDAAESLAKAAKCEELAAKAVGAERVQLLLQASQWREFSRGQMAEGIRQISKQVNNIVDARMLKKAGMRVSDYNQALWDMQQLANMVDEGLEVTLFKKIIKEEYGLTLTQYAEFVSKCLS